MIKRLKRSIAFISAIAVVAGMVPDAGIMKLSAAETYENTMNTVSSNSYTFASNLQEGYELSGEAEELTMPGEAQMLNGSINENFSDDLENLHWELLDGILTIEGTGDMSSVPGKLETCRESIKEIQIASGVTSIADGAFAGCTNLTTVSFDSWYGSTLSIRSGAFEGCTALESIVIPNYVTTMGNGVFWGCSSLQSVTFEAGSQLNAISDSAFGFCTSLKTINIPDSVKTIDEAAFFGCSALESIMIPESVTTIGDRIFEECSNLKAVTCVSRYAAESYLTSKYPDISIVRLYKISPALGSTEGYTITQADKTALSESGLLTDVDGNISFRIEAAPGYKKNFTVKAYGTEVTAVDGVYTISGITENKTISLTIEGAGLCSHSYNNGFCPECGAYEPAGYNESQNYYEISNAGQLYWFAGLVNGDASVCTGDVTQNKSANAVLTKDITVNSGLTEDKGLLQSLSYDSDGNVTNEDSFRSWTPVGNDSNRYTGTFDGQGFTVSGLYFNNTDSSTGECVGLFGYVGSGGKVSKVGVVDSYFNAYRFVGGVCGDNSGNITECYNKGIVNGNYWCTGGVCGENKSGTIQSCYNEGSVTGKDEYTGGVCGMNENATIINCYNTGKVVGNKSGCGGVCGNNYTGGIIKNCHSIGTVSLSTTGTSGAIGGVCGYNKSTIINCYFDSNQYTGNAVGATGDGSNVSGNVLGKTTEQFNSGEVAYLLQDGQETGENNVKPEVWGQTLSENGDTYPVLKKTGDEGNTVYTYKCGENNAYTNDSSLIDTTREHDFSAEVISDNAKKLDATCTEKAKYYYSCSVCGEVEKNDEHVFEDGELAEHTDENLDGKCDAGGEEFKTYEQLGKLIDKVNQNLSDGKYAEVQYTTASIDKLRKALVAANAITAQSSDTEVATAFDKLLAASTVNEGGLIKADKNIVIKFADESVARGIAVGNGWYANNDTVTLKVTPSVGYTFSKWTSDTAGNTSVGTESTYTFTLAADSPDAYYAWLDEVKYTVTCNTAEGGTCSTNTEDGKYVYGQTATVTATANENYAFVGWKDSYGSTVSTDAVYSFAVIGNTTLTPEFVKVKTDEGADITYVTVSFYHQSGKLLDSQKVVSGEGQITTTVNAPTKAGFDFLGWSAKASGATAEDVVDFNTATFSEDTSLYPVFKAQDITYTLTINGQSESKAPQSKVTVTADPIDGQQFVGWKNSDGNIVSYDSTYTFIITGDTTLTSYYEPVNAVIEKTPTINMSAPVYEDINDNGKSYYKMTFYFDYTLPEDCKLIDIGTIKVKGEDLSSDGITLDTENVSQYSVLSKLGVDGQFYYSKSNYYRTGHTVAGYMIYEKSGIRYTVYSNAAYGIKEN